MSKLQKITVAVLVMNVLALVGYDVWAAMQGGGPATISWMLTWSGQQWWGSTLVFALGYLFGHFFAQDNKVTLSDLPGWAVAAAQRQVATERGLPVLDPQTTPALTTQELIYAAPGTPAVAPLEPPSSDTSSHQFLPEVPKIPETPSSTT